MSKSNPGESDDEDDESKNISKRTERGERDPVAMTEAVVGGTRSGMLMTTAGGGGNKEGRRGRKMAEMNRNQTLYRGRA